MLLLLHHEVKCEDAIETCKLKYIQKTKEKNKQTLLCRPIHLDK